MSSASCSSLADLGGRDSKLEHFIRALQVATDDGRSCLVFSEFTDTVDTYAIRCFLDTVTHLPVTQVMADRFARRGAGVRYRRRRSPLV